MLPSQAWTDDFKFIFSNVLLPVLLFESILVLFVQGSPILGLEPGGQRGRSSDGEPILGTAPSDFT